MDSSSVNLLAILQGRALETERAARRLTDALETASLEVDQAYENLDESIESIDAFVQALEKRAKIDWEIGKLEFASDDYHLALEQLEDRTDRHKQIGKLHATLGTLYDELKQEDKAIHHWELAIQAFEKCSPPLLLNISSIANNLGFIAKAKHDLVAAEFYFQRAYEIVNTELGRDHEQTATISSNLGALYHASGLYEKARDQHMSALETRRKLFGEDHGDTAQAYNNLALAMLKSGDRTHARSYLEKALACYEDLGEEFYDDLEAVATNYCAFLREEGEGHQANVITDRILSILGK